MNLLEMSIAEPFRRFFDKAMIFLPNLFMAVLILITGIVLGIILKSLFLKAFGEIGIDKFFGRLGAGEMMKKGGVQEPVSALLSKLIGWLTALIFAGIALSTIEIPAVEKLVDKLTHYMPSIVIALAILFIGYLVGNFLGRAALIASVNAGIKLSGLIGKAVRFTILMLSATMALEQLGIGKETVIIAFAIIFGGAVLALAIAFGLAGKDIAKEFLEKKIKGEEKKDEIEHL